MRHLLLLTLLLTGCAKYEYDIVQPAPRRHVGKENRTHLDLPPLKYGMITVDSKLVMLIHNQAENAVTLMPDKSYIVDQHGASRATAGLTIAPGSYIKLIFPPPRPYVRDDNNVTFGFGAYDGGGGIGTGVGVGRSYGGGSVRNLDQNVYWDWDGEGAVKFHFVYTDGKDSFTHELVIERKRT